MNTVPSVATKRTTMYSPKISLSSRSPIGSLLVDRVDRVERSLSSPQWVTYATCSLSLLKLAGLAALLGAGRLFGVQTSPPVSAAKTSQSAL